MKLFARPHTAVRRLHTRRAESDVGMGSSGTRPRQVAVIPVRRTEGGVWQVCLIRRKGSSKWGIPKGFIDRGHTHAQAALAEANEEAGLEGRIRGDAIGTYEYKKGLLCLTVAVYVMEVTDERPTWLEMRWRERAWYSVEEAGALLRRHHVWPLYDRIRPTLPTIVPAAPRESPSDIEPESH